MKRASFVRAVVSWAILSPLVLLTLFPFAVMLSTALKPTADVLAYPPNWLPSTLAWHNIADMWVAADFGVALLNSIAISVCATLLCLLIATPAAYAMARLPLPARGAYRQFLLITQMLSPILLVLGLFRLAALIPWGDGTLVDTRISVIVVYAAFNIAFAAWMLSSYFRTIPPDLEEAAWIDGCGRFGAAWRVFLPVAAPALAVTSIVTFVACWNEFTVALTLLRDPSRLTLTLRVVNLVAGRYTVEWNQVMAAALLATLPVALVFAALQRWLIGGLTLGAVK